MKDLSASNVWRADRAKISSSQSIGILLNRIISSFNLFAFLLNWLGYYQISWVDVKRNDHHALQLFIASSTVYVSNRLGYYQISWVEVKSNNHRTLQLFIANSAVYMSNRLGYHQINWVNVKPNDHHALDNYPWYIAYRFRLVFKQNHNNNNNNIELSNI